MAPEKPDREPTLFEVLSISPRSLDGQDPASQAKIARQAYRRALLKHHPDRQAQNTTDENAAAASDSSSSAASNKSSSSQQQHFTVDQITEAYTVLSDAKKRREYTRTLRSQTKTTVSGGAGAYANTRRRRKSRASGTDVLVLDDDMAWDGKRKLYYHACDGCGKARGFGLKEDEIDDDSEEDLELTLQCVGCEKSLRVLVPALDDGQWGEQVNNSGMQTQQQSQMYNMAPHPQTSKKDEETPKKSRGWGFRLGLGLSLGGGASARAGAGR